MLLNKKLLLLVSVFILSGCVTQLVTTPAQVATQTTQTAAQTANQAAQTAIPFNAKSSKTLSQASAVKPLADAVKAKPLNK